MATTTTLRRRRCAGSRSSLAAATPTTTTTLLSPSPSQQLRRPWLTIARWPAAGNTGAPGRGSGTLPVKEHSSFACQLACLRELGCAGADYIYARADEHEAGSHDRTDRIGRPVAKQGVYYGGSLGARRRRKLLSEQRGREKEGWRAGLFRACMGSC